MAKQMKILVVEDDMTMREIVVQKLDASGFAIVEAEDGRKAIDRFAAEQPDIVLLDLMLPEVDGFGVLQNIRSNPDKKLSATPVIILTNLWSKEEIIRTKSLGVSAYIIKAYMTTEEILDKVQEVIKTLNSSTETPAEQNPPA